MSETATLKVVCCECKIVIEPSPDDNVSHGYCRPCSTKMLWLSGLNQKELTGFTNMMKEKYGDRI